MDHLPPDLPVQAVLIWIEIRNREACLEAFETADDEAAVAVKDFGLTQVAYVIATRRRAGSLTIKDKAAQFEKLGDGSVRTTFKKHSSPKGDYEFFKAEKELLQALVDGSITAYTIATGVTPQKIDAMLWQGRVFTDEVRGDRYHVVAASAGHQPLRSIRFKKDDIIQKWPPEGGQKRGPKAGRTSNKDIWCSVAVEMLVSGEVAPKHGVKIEIAKRIWEKGYGRYQPNTIAGCISKTVDDWIAKHKAT